MKRKLISTLILTMAVSACQVETLEPSSVISDGEMKFDFLSPGAQTKATDRYFEDADVIGLYVTDYVDESTPMPLQVSGNRANNFAVTFDGTLWTPEKTVYWGEGKSDIYAYYPYIRDVDDVNTLSFSVSTDQNDGEDSEDLGGYEASDFLWAKAEGLRQTDEVVYLNMKHVMSKLTVRIVAGEDYVGSLPEDASVILHNTVTSARIDLGNGAVVKDPYCGETSIEMRRLGLKTYNGVDALVYEAIVVPQMLEINVPLFEINSKSVSYLVEDSFNFRPGISYIYTITLNSSTSAIKVEIGCELEDWNSTGGGGNEDDGSEEGGSDDGLIYTNLSSEGTANCYIVSEAGDYKFKAVQGNLDATVGNVKSVEVLWESFGTDVAPNAGDLIASASYSNGYIHFSTPENFTEGNAVIAAKNSAGIILWSWHIWMTDEPEIHVYDRKAGLMMDRNLGATSATPGEVGTLGLLYQSGRKDPFLGSSSISAKIEAASTGTWSVDARASIDDLEKNPTTYYSEYEGVRWGAEKTASDPCPVGWQVPVGGKDGFFMNADLLATPYDYDDAGMYFNITYPAVAWYPAAGYRGNDGELNAAGFSGEYLSISDSDSQSSRLHFSSDYYDFGLNLSSMERSAYSVRCFRVYDDAFLPEIVFPDFSSSENLASEGTANSYIVSSAGTYTFPAVKGNSSLSVGPGAAAKVMWESFGTDEKPAKGALVEAAKYENGYVYFKTADTFREGNALIAVENEAGEILWSWHIWMTDLPEEHVYYNNAGTMMDRNLGATSANPEDHDILGLQYQWGRKDPFMGSLTTSFDPARSTASTYLWPSSLLEARSLEFAIEHPTVSISGQRFDWLYSDSNIVDDTRWQQEKTIYDPCPSGWRVPDENIWAEAVGNDEAMSGISGHERNYSGVLGDGTIIYPNHGWHTNESYNSVCYWTCSIAVRDNHEAYAHVLCTDGSWLQFGETPCSERCYVRCQKEE